MSTSGRDLRFAVVHFRRHLDGDRRTEDANGEEAAVLPGLGTCRRYELPMILIDEPDRALAAGSCTRNLVTIQISARRLRSDTDSASDSLHPFHDRIIRFARGGDTQNGSNFLRCGSRPELALRRIHEHASRTL
jgi:hypothetical protein